MDLFGFVKQFASDGSDFLGAWGKSINDAVGFSKSNDVDGDSDGSFLGALGGAVGKTLGGSYDTSSQKNYFGENPSVRGVERTKLPQGKVIMTESVSPEALAQKWHSRLTVFQEVDAVSGGKLK